MYKIKILVLGLLSLTMVGCGAIDSGNGGVRTSWQNEVMSDVETSGFYTSLISSVEEYVGKEIMIPLNDMTPKAGDNLTMQELDVEIYYKTNIPSFSGLKTKYANAHQVVEIDGSDYVYPAYLRVKSLAREAAYNGASEIDSLLIHLQRDQLASKIKEKLQASLDEDDQGVFTITTVIIKQAKTDQTLEESIRLATRKEKELEAAQKDVLVKEQDAMANNKLASSLTPQIMRIKELDAMVKACEQGTCIIDFTNGSTKPLINVRGYNGARG